MDLAFITSYPRETMLLMRLPTLRQLASLMARLLLAGLAVCMPAAHAARPMITDDARIVDPKACQVESWVRANGVGPGLAWAVPGCNPTGNLELSAGAGYERPGGEGRVLASLVQGKTILRPLRTHDWGMGLTLGYATDRPAGGLHQSGPYLNVPMSASLFNDRLVMHLNLGVRRPHPEGQTLGTWGLGSETRLHERVQLILETFGERNARPLMHGGLRFWLVPDRVQFDTTVGGDSRGSQESRWVSIGLRLLSPPFLP